jgi:large subunit ribosomal protein L18
MKPKIRSHKRRMLMSRRVRVQRSIQRTDRTRLMVYRSSKHIYAQLVDPISGQTIASVSSRSKAVMGEAASTGNVEAARRVGKAVAELAREKQIEEVVFNRNGFHYHGRVKALADAAREAGLRF